MGTEGNVVQTACFQITHLRTVPCTWSSPVLQQYVQVFPQAAGKIDTQCQESPERNAVEKEHIVPGMMEGAQSTHVLMSMCAQNVLVTIRDLCVDQAQSHWNWK